MLKLTIVTMTLLASAASVAQDHSTLPAVAVQADLGYAHHKLGTDDDNESGGAFSQGIALTYQLNTHWSARLQYADAGDFTVFSIQSGDLDGGVWYEFERDFDTSASWLGLTAQYQTEQLFNHWSFGVRLGAGFWKHKFTLRDTITSVSNSQFNHLIGESVSETGSDSGVGLLAGVFSQFHFTEHLALTFDLDLAPFTSKAAEEMPVFQGLSDLKTDYNVSRVAVGIKYRF